MKDFIQQTQNFSLVAEFNKKKVVGFDYGRESNPHAEVLDKWKSRKVASIETMAVDEDSRRHGIATSLLTELFTEFKRTEFVLVTLSVPAAEIAARKMYGKWGLSCGPSFSGRDYLRNY